MCYVSLGFLSPSGPVRGLGEALYFSTVTFTTLGYGDFQPSTLSRPVAALQALFGYIYLGSSSGRRRT